MKNFAPVPAQPMPDALVEFALTEGNSPIGWPGDAINRPAPAPESPVNLEPSLTIPTSWSEPTTFAVAVKLRSKGTPPPRPGKE